MPQNVELLVQYKDNTVKTTIWYTYISGVTGKLKEPQTAGTTVNPSLWKPGQACPVLACRQKAKHIRHSSQFKQHWVEKHEKMIAFYKCAYSQCTSGKFKRKSDLYRHLRQNHGCNGEDVFSSFVSCGIFPNQHFVDPFPLTQEIVFGSLVTDLCLS